MAKKVERKKPNYFGFDHAKVNKNFEGELEFVNEFCVNGEYVPVAVYRSANPNTEKGHKKYMLLQSHPKPIVRGMTEEEMEPFRFQEAIICRTCNTLVYSVNRHDMSRCHCKKESTEVFIDGGREYTRILFGKKAKYDLVKYDLLKDKFRVVRKDAQKRKR